MEQKIKIKSFIINTEKKKEINNKNKSFIIIKKK